MAKALSPITLASARDIPFDKLVLSQSNVRRIKAGVLVEELAASIARRGLIQSLHVRPVLDEDGAETGLFEVPAGGRRFQALELLVKQKRLAKTAPVPCIVSDTGGESDVLVAELSLAENIERAPLHPLDQFRAFQTLRETGMTEEAIAAAFFVDAKVVKQRLRLASVSPALLEVYAEDAMTLEQLMAFTVSDDHARQEQVWQAIKDSWSKEPYTIRRLLTETTVRASDRRALFVGVSAYEAAGGIVLRDLFETDDGGWLQDVALLDRMVAEKLKCEAEAIAAAGWAWVEAAVSFPYGHDRGLRQIAGSTIDLTEEERAAREALRDEYDLLEAEHAEAEELPEEVDRRLGEIEAALEAYEHRPVVFSPEQMARAGVFVSIGADGRLMVDRGHVRPDDEDGQRTEDGEAGRLPDATGGVTPRDAREPAAITTGEPGTGEESAEETDTLKPLPESLVVELTAYRTLALRDALAAHPHVALTALLHRLVLDCFGSRGCGAALEAFVRTVYFPVQAPGLADSLPAQQIAARHAAWQADLPDAEDEDRLWSWLESLDEPSRISLLAHCVSFGVNALLERPNPYSGTGVSQQGLERRLREANRLARATGLDLVEAGWRPTVESYLGRVTKPRILAAVREGVGEAAAQRIDHLKKPDMAREAERLLAETGWLPEPLRLGDADSGTTGVEVARSACLPAILTSEADGAEPEAIDDPARGVPSGAGEDGTARVEEDHSQGMAAE
ncbi:ParB/RepB/Spo0J family partition protein [Paracoccus aerius]|uniref:ParB/RepB/Spo0J family partition protein n=1 Tax=Paracoccus aerius TaxID=1915382 RepID=A0ABS1S5H8_9RHOB|nr:ParB/RepB/Spo0J family partition protein [Paracoccus aerius]MBL3673971.1 ParB/RepB/Spo0J family partition protein [Paracoccus aerius]GHG23435.1 chromosome partitioning protein ParB [Paracoccus aerius]